MKNYNLKFKVLPHTADLKIQAYGETKEELFKNLMIGMFQSARYEGGEKETEREIKISSIDLPSLLVDFLSEVLYLVETRKEVYQKVKFKKLTGNEIKVTLIGKKLKRMGVHIKAVTYHSLDIHQRENGTWEATVLFDI